MTQNPMHSSRKIACKTAFAGSLLACLSFAEGAAAEVTLYSQEGLRGRTFTASGTIDNLDRTGSNDRASTAIVQRGRWELCEDAYEAVRDVSGFGSPPPDDGSAFGSGWWSEVHTDLRSLVGARVGDPLSRPYCGRGRRAACRRVLLSALTGAIANAKERYGVEALTDIEMQAVCDDDALCDEIVFTTAGAVGMPDMHWQDRPTFQQIVEVQGHRPR